MPITETQVDAFQRDGYLLIPGFYDEKSQIEPIREQIRQIITILCKKHGVETACDTPVEAMAEGYMGLITLDRRLGGAVYDAVKQIPEFMRLVAEPQNAQIFSELRPGSQPGIAAGGFGIRIDNPSEDRYRAPWHQEFPAQLRSLDGVVFWSPLVEITPELGPVEIANGSHKEGPIPVYEDNGDIVRSGAYSLRLDREQERLRKYPIVAPCTKPGDLILMDFLTLHQSGRNAATRSRWSMQFRYFNFADPVGVDIAWAGSFAAGKRFEEFFPNIKVDPQ